MRVFVLLLTAVNATFCIKDWLAKLFPYESPTILFTPLINWPNEPQYFDRDTLSAKVSPPPDINDEPLTPPKEKVPEPSPEPAVTYRSAVLSAPPEPPIHRQTESILEKSVAADHRSLDVPHHRRQWGRLFGARTTTVKPAGHHDAEETTKAASSETTTTKAETNSAELQDVKTPPIGIPTENKKLQSVRGGKIEPRVGSQGVKPGGYVPVPVLEILKRYHL